VQNIKILPGVTYHPGFVGEPDAAEADLLEQVAGDLVQRTGIMGGREYQVPRLEAWYGPHAYRFNGADFPARPLPPVLAALKVRLECYLPGVEFSGCLVNVYRDGRDSVAWHSDDEPDMGDPVVASISLGAPRDFLFRAINPVAALASALCPNRAKVKLEHGSLLIMARGAQGTYQHSLPKRAAAGRRVNLTFRAPG
jgi:alkylated DNA repair dioxygenase AlkB